MPGDRNNPLETRMDLTAGHEPTQGNNSKLDGVIASMTGTETESLVPILTEVNENKTAFEILTAKLNIQGAHWNYFQHLNTSQATEIAGLLRDFLTAVNASEDRKSLEEKAATIADKLDS